MADYKLPICWLGTETKDVIGDNGEAVKTHIVTEEEVNLNCHCPLPVAAHFCMEGHMTECHAGMTCEEADCFHYSGEEDYYSDNQIP